MASSNFYTDNADLLFQVKHGLDWDEIVRLVENDLTLPDGPKTVEEARAFYEDVLKATGEFVAKELAPRAAAIDKQGTWLEDGEVKFSPELDAVMEGFKALGLYGLTVPRELGGSNAPMSLYFIVGEIIARGDVSVMTHFSFHGGIASSMLLYSIKEGSAVAENGRLVKTRWDDDIRKIAAGEAFGCMVLTEPGAGSDLSAIRTRAVEKDGKWIVNGEKIFITSGHGQYQFVLAKTEDESKVDGLKALSLFLVPRKLERDGKLVDNVKVTKVEEKLGHHGSATCALLYEDSVGELVGERGQGFELMLLLMNSARIGVGFEAIGNAEAALRLAQAYAAERRTMGKPIEQHELIAEKLLDMETWIAAMRALGVRGAERGRALHAPGDEAEALAALPTPSSSRRSRPGSRSSRRRRGG